MVVLKVLLILIAVIVVSVIINGIKDYNRRPKNPLTFDKDLFKIVGMPIIKLYNNGKVFHFVVDSGAALSTIDVDSLKNLEYSKTNIVGTAYGIDGNIVETSTVCITLHYDKVSLPNNFQVLDLSQMCENFEKEHNIHLAGLLGSDFLSKYEYVLDFDKLVMFNKK